MRSPTLGAGFLEKVYRRALLRELGIRGIRATAEASLTVIYKGQSVGEYFTDLLVEDVLVVELKCGERLSSEHTAQCLNYLRASGRTVCLLVNFQKPKSSGSASSMGFRIPEPIEAPTVDSTRLVHLFPGHYTSNPRWDRPSTFVACHFSNTAT